MRDLIDQMNETHRKASLILEQRAPGLKSYQFWTSSSKERGFKLLEQLKLHLPAAYDIYNNWNKKPRKIYSVRVRIDGIVAPEIATAWEKSELKRPTLEKMKVFTKLYVMGSEYPRTVVIKGGTYKDTSYTINVPEGSKACAVCGRVHSGGIMCFLGIQTYQGQILSGERKKLNEVGKRCVRFWYPLDSATGRAKQTFSQGETNVRVLRRYIIDVIGLSGKLDEGSTIPNDIAHRAIS